MELQRRLTVSRPAFQRTDTDVSTAETVVGDAQDGATTPLEKSKLSQDDQSGNTTPELELPEVGYGLVVELPPMDGGWRAWRFCACATVLETLVWGPTFAFGAWQEVYLSIAPFETSSSIAISGIGTSSLALNYGTMLPMILFCQKYPHLMKRLMGISLGLYVLSFLLASFATQVWHLILTQGIMCGLFGGMVYGPVYLIVRPILPRSRISNLRLIDFAKLAEWFKINLSLAGGIVFCGSCFGGTVFPPLIVALVQHVSFQWTLRIFALLVATVGGLAVLCVERRVAAADESSLLKKPEERVEPSDWTFFSDPLFLAVACTITLQGFFYSSIAVYLPSYAVQYTTPVTSNLVLSAMNAASVVGQSSSGWLCDRYGYKSVMLLSGVLSVIGLFAVLQGTNQMARIWSFSIFNGLFVRPFLPPPSRRILACTDTVCRLEDSPRPGSPPRPTSPPEPPKPPPSLARSESFVVSLRF